MNPSHVFTMWQDSAHVVHVRHAGNSVCAFVHGFQPYFYIEAPRGFGPDDCNSLSSQLNVRAVETYLHSTLHLWA